ncbi:ferritin-like domain-containing protein [Candidatus Cerribacteria bacterium 'Amazon FNV 2010 28 9']|uniref:Ferritin-like domain-containing protein n=1 Tax=Candidatus Cerribacteria bacterium 'Amazon FNV 2010 28 9' TaxID=2081795 RepID=A0A317JSF8_9BACT|nr:MAG: ferritin-like domain-containing protein [Candidatus Cerribacteria bacterium 'Amazon FNV 2010 28 9']
MPATTISNLTDLLQSLLADLYATEQAIIAALPEMIDDTMDTKLHDALQEHLDTTKEQLSRLETINTELEFSTTKDAEGIDAIIHATQQIVNAIIDSATKDAAIIAAAQKVEHYEIASYGSAAEFARQLKFNSVASLLETTLGEEKDADAKLTSIAQGGLFQKGVNEKAVEE